MDNQVLFSLQAPWDLKCAMFELSRQQPDNLVAKSPESSHMARVSSKKEESTPPDTSLALDIEARQKPFQEMRRGTGSSSHP